MVILLPAVARLRSQASERHHSGTASARPRVLAGVEGAAVPGAGAPPESPVVQLVVRLEPRQTAGPASGRFKKTTRNLE